MLLAMLLSACVSNHGNELNLRDPAQYDVSREKQEGLNFESLLRSIKNSQAKSVEEALSVLSKQYPEYLKFHTLLYDSFSLHESSYLEPRAIVFGPRANFILTFNGGTHMRAGNAFEVMQYQEQTGKFEFREIAFKAPLKQEAAETLTAADIEFENESLMYTKANPNKCMICHSQNPRPIWETYFIWPGAYGSNDDALTSLFNKKEVRVNPNYATFRDGGKSGVSQGRLIQLKPGITDKEFISFKRFIASKASHPRYRYLPNRAIDTAFVRLNAGEPMESIDTTDAIDKEAKDLKLSEGAQTLHARPNLDLNMMLYQLTVQSFVTRSLANPATKTLPFKIAWVRSCRTNPSNGVKDNWTIESRDPFKWFEAIISKAEMDQIQKVAGPWKDFYRSFISAELDMQASKIQRLERTFGENSLEVSNSYIERPQPEARSQKYYTTIKGRPLNRHEQMASYDESDDLFQDAISAYIAKGFGQEMQSYTTNFNRVPSFRDGGYRNLINEFSERNLISKPSAGYGFQPNDKVICPEIALKAQGH